jgi:hypothetical protein
MRVVVVRNLSERDESDRKSRRVIIEKGEKPRNVEMENPIWVQFLALIDGAGLIDVLLTFLH